MTEPIDSFDNTMPPDEGANAANPNGAGGAKTGSDEAGGENVAEKPARRKRGGAAAEGDAEVRAEIKTEAPGKKLGKGAANRKSGEKATLKGAGVATSKALMPTTKRGKRAAADAAVEKTFDPAADLPMYREGMDWFVLRVASNKESSVRETLLRKVQIEGMEDLVGRIMVPTEKTKTLKAGKQRVTETKLYPGYVFVEMKLEPDGRIPQDVFFLIKETSGVGDFVGTAGRPTPMAPHEVEKMLFDSRRPEEAPTVKMDFLKGDKVTIKEGPFQSFQGTVDEVLPDRGLVRVLVTIFGRQAPIELEYWQIARAEG
ncbi:MAG: transcription termination/antitermination protein NusG [Phycisphaerales bacterium]